MMPVLVGLLCFSILAVFCFRNFFVQLVSIKLLLDALVLLGFSVRGTNQESYSVQVAAIMVSSLGILVFFILMASGIQRFSKSNNLDLEADSD
jgi:hypothetical protein